MNLFSWPFPAVPVIAVIAAVFGFACWLAFRGIADLRRDRQFGAMIAAELKRGPEPRPAGEETAAFAAWLLGRGARP